MPCDTHDCCRRHPKACRGPARVAPSAAANGSILRLVMTGGALQIDRPSWLPQVVRTANVAAFIRGVGQYNELFGGRTRGRNLWYIHQNFSEYVRRRPR